MFYRKDHKNIIILVLKMNIYTSCLLATSNYFESNTSFVNTSRNFLFAIKVETIQMFFFPEKYSSFLCSDVCIFGLMEFVHDHQCNYCPTS